jgi:hypothetical protein
MVSAYSMVARTPFTPGITAFTAGIITLLLILFPLFCGCLQVEPEELPPQAAVLPAEIAGTPTIQVTMDSEGGKPPALSFTSPKYATLYTDQDFPPEVEQAVSDFISGQTADTINGYLRWESVRARTDAAGKARIQEQIRLINYGLYNTSLKENVSVFVGITREQAKRVRNESVFSESGYLVASSDPSVIYHRMADSGRDSDGYFTMCVIDFRKGNHVLFVNTTEREFLLPQGGIWDVAREDTYQELEYSIDSIPRYDDTVPTKVRLVFTREHP